MPDGSPGEYQVRGPNLFMGYAGQPELTAKTVTEEGFYRSGDLIVRSPEGYFNWSGRTKDIIRRGGLQIDPIELENLLAGHPAVSTVVVVGLPDERLGERAVSSRPAGRRAAGPRRALRLPAATRASQSRTCPSGSS